jgi:hypothetical protein
MTPAVGEALVRHGHKVLLPAEVQLDPESASPDEILEAAHKSQLDIITTDGDLAEAPFGTPTPFIRSIVFLQLPGGDVEQDDAIDRLFDRYPRMSLGKLYTVTETRVKVRQLPGK